MSSDVEQIIQESTPDTSFWCWMGESALIPLILVNTKSENGFQSFEEQIQETSGKGLKGIATILADRRLMITAVGASKETLNTIVQYAKDSGFTTLDHTRVVNMNESGQVVNIFEDESLWDTKKSSLEGPEMVVQCLKAMGESDSCWFWFGADHTEAKIVMGLKSKDPQGAGFASLVGNAAKVFEEEPLHITGVLEKNKSGTLRLVTGKDIGPVVEHLAAWVNSQSENRPSLRVLNSLRLIQMEGSQLRSFLSLNRQGPSSTSHSELQGALSSMKANSSIPFVFNESLGLFLSRDKARRAAYLVTNSGSVLIKGRLELSEKGFYIFKVRSSAKGLLESVVRWWISCDGEQSLPQLKKSRVLQLDDKKAIVFRKRDDSLWP